MGIESFLGHGLTHVDTNQHVKEFADVARAFVPQISIDVRPFISERCMAGRVKGERAETPSVAGSTMVFFIQQMMV